MTVFEKKLLQELKNIAEMMDVDVIKVALSEIERSKNKCNSL
jgi:hypothetical protein